MGSKYKTLNYEKKERLIILMYRLLNLVKYLKRKFCMLSFKKCFILTKKRKLRNFSMNVIEIKTIL